MIIPDIQEGLSWRYWKDKNGSLSAALYVLLANDPCFRGGPVQQNLAINDDKSVIQYNTFHWSIVKVRSTAIRLYKPRSA